MLYEEYLVVDCGMRPSNVNSNQSVYFCELVSCRQHRIGFTLIIQGCVGEKIYCAQHQAVTSSIKKGMLLKCEFAYQMHDRSLELCLSGLCKLKARRWDDEGAEISPEDFFNSSRGFWAVAVCDGEWMRFPGLIHCTGQASIPIDRDQFNLQYHEFLGPKLGALVWKPVITPRAVVSRLQNACAFFQGWFPNPFKR